MKLHKAMLLVLFAAPAVLAGAQTDFKKEWKEVNSLYYSEDYNKAYNRASELFNEAQRIGDSRNTLTGAFHLARIAAEYQEYAEDSALARYNAIMPKLTPIDQAVCHGFMAKFYREYYMMNRWRINRNSDTDESGLDYKLWPQERFEREINNHLAEALKDEAALKATAIKDVESFCHEPYGNGVLTTPTLYDLVVNMAIESIGDNAEKLRMRQKLIDFHSGDEDCLRIWLDMRKLELESSVPNKPKPTADDYVRHVEKYRGTECDLVSRFYYEAAQMLMGEKKYVEAKALCDKAQAQYPKSDGAKLCVNITNKIVHPECSVTMTHDEMADHAMLGVATSRNADTLYFRIIKWFDHSKIYQHNEVVEAMAKQRAVQQWSMSLKHRDDYQEQHNYVYLPQVPTGSYYLLISTTKDFKANGLSYGGFVSCDAQIVTALPNNAMHGYVLLRGSGAPVPGQKMQLERYDYEKGRYVSISGATAVTDATGYYEFKNSDAGSYTSLRVVTDYKGVKLDHKAGLYSKTRHYESVGFYCQFDRPVYKLGETVSFAYVAHFGDRRTHDQVYAGAELKVSLRDVNRKTVDSVELTTDEFGVCHGELKIPTDALPGAFQLYTTYKVGDRSGSDYESVKVEEYKQPKFTVKMYGDKSRHSFGKELTVNGMAASYSQAPIDGAKVSYTVTRREMYRPWRWWYMPANKEKVVAGGEITTDADGKFEIRFTPMPDSSIELSNKPCFVYTVRADVTDINGETHSQFHTLRVGYENSHLLLPTGGEVSELDTIEVSYCNLDGDPIEGTVTVTVECLQQPSQPHLSHGFLEAGISHSITRAEFAKRFGLLAYDLSDTDPDQWPVSRKVLNKTLKLTKDGGGEVALGKLEPGVYRITARVTDSEGNKLDAKTTYTYMPHDGNKVQSQELAWISDEGRTLQPGDTYRLRIGSRYKNVKMLYIVSTEGDPIERRVIELDGDIKTIELPIVEAYKGGVHIDLLAMKENMVWNRTVTVSVPYTEKQLDVQIESFRDKLRPGENETWTIKVKDANGQAIKQSSNLMLTMYDAALNTYGSLTAGFFAWYGNYNPSMLAYSSEQFSPYDYQTSPQTTYVGGVNLRTWTLLDGVFSHSRIAFSKSMNARGRARAEATGAVLEREVFAVEDAVAMRPSELAEMEMEETVDEGGAATEEETVRTNLNTLAFFKPTLRTGDDGTVTCSFTVPELLTEWSIRGVAHTKDMKSGSLSKSLITQKELMVQPNVPRFLRQGDTVDFMAKVTNLTGDAQQVTVTFDLTDATTNQVINKSDNQKNITIPAKRSEQVTFRIAVPKDVYMVNYRIVAKGAKHSDGEQDCLPVLTNRQLVTVSQAMYINGKGEKSYPLPAASSQQSASREPMLLKVEFTANPLWYAIQSLPYVEDHQNPSNIFLMNQLYTNSIAFGIVKDNPNIEQVFREWEKDTVNPLMSQLEKNEDVKQTVLDETPWLRDGTGETQRMHRIAAYFDKARLTSELNKTEKKLWGQQRGDGGWSWIPGGKYSSLYTTQYILENLGKLSLNASTQMQSGKQSDIKKALKYVDEETYDFYRRYLKHTEFEALNIGYLYMRSFYTNADYKFQHKKYKEAYDYFYRNTLKHYTEYKSLYMRATLALVFHRGGNHKEALDIIRRIKESALYSDEMGMYWRDNISSWWWYERPIETQALLIQAFSEITPNDRESIALMQQWLLKQKQTTSWSTDVATVEAVGALLMGNGNTLDQTENSTLVTIAGHTMDAPAQAGTGYRSQSWRGEEITRLLSDGKPEVKITKLTDGIAWGATYYQFFDDMENIERSDMGVKMQKTVYRVKTDGTLEVVGTKKGQGGLKVGDRVRIRILIDCDRNLEYVELKDGRPGCLEPVSTSSGWSWNSGLSYYAAVRNASNSFYIDRIDKGKYVVEYDLFVTNPGTFTMPASTIQCLYAPEFRANSEGSRLTVNN